MVASRNRPKGARSGPFGLSVLVLSLLPTYVGQQDIGASLAQQSQALQRWRPLVTASPFGTAHAASFNFPRPIGTAIPEQPEYRLASFSAYEPDDGELSPRDFGIVPMPRSRPQDFPVVNRRLKGDLLVARPLPRQQPQSEPQPPSQPGGTRDLKPGRVKTVAFPRPEQSPSGVEPLAPEAVPAEPDFDFSVVVAPEPGPAELPAAIMPEPDAVALPDVFEAVEAASDSPQLDPIDDTNPAVRLARLYFGPLPIGEAVGGIEPWPAGEEPVLVMPPPQDLKVQRAVAVPATTLAAKGEVTGAGKRPKTPAERLGLDIKSRAKAEKCLAEAVYFESRGEAKRGQIAVAQVVMNRVFSGFYPNNVCGVVYQNAHRHLACQFTFACDGIRDVVTEPEMWTQAKEIARDTLDGRLWLTDIAKSTHYHAYWVHPWWVSTMRKLSRIGVHTFYRPRRWGDGADAPIWGPGVTVANASAAKL